LISSGWVNGGGEDEDGSMFLAISPFADFPVCRVNVCGYLNIYRPRQLSPRYALEPILPYIAILSKGFMRQALTSGILGIETAKIGNIMALSVLNSLYLFLPEFKSY
jgi:hypothetical protein